LLLILRSFCIGIVDLDAVDVVDDVVGDG